MTALVAIGLFVGTVLAWTNQRLWLWVSRSWRLLAWSAFILVGTAVFWAMGGGTALMAHHDEGEPFSWTAGVSICPVSGSGFSWWCYASSSWSKGPAI